MSAEILQKLSAIEKTLAASPNRVRVTRCTQAEFDKLPAMVSRAEFMDWTGMNHNEVAEEVTAKRVEIYRPKGQTKARYYKREIARLGGWKM